MVEALPEGLQSQVRANPRECCHGKGNPGDPRRLARNEIFRLSDSSVVLDSGGRLT